MTYFASHVGLIVSLFVNPIAMTKVSWKYYILFCLLNAVLFIIVWFFFPETKGHSLEEIALVFEGDQAAVRNAIPEYLDKGVENEARDIRIETIKI